ncbi:GTP-binding protein [Paenibacillus apiarius]|uniref:GTP-binding protein n=1 Tax=Paenibacillus apiarius TaxID=46240 RepID=UPI003B3A6DB3
MNKTIGIFAHVDAGKTTLAEQLLYHTRSIRSRGRVDDKDAFLDGHDIEKERGITIFADQAVMTYKDSTYTLIDTPGHVDFSSEMERAVQVMDYAIVVISAVEGVQGHTETVWQLLSKHRVPAFFFINKTDRVGADAQRVIEDIRLNLTPDVFDVASMGKDGGMSEELSAFIAERDDRLLELYMDEAYDRDVWLQAMKVMLKEHKLFPCASGSALQVREEVSYGAGADRITEKITSIRVYNGHKHQNVERAEAGQLFAVTGVSAASTGDGLGALQEQAVYDIVPTLTSKVIYPPSLHAKEVLRCFRLLDVEDPSLHVLWDEHVQEIHIHVMGAIQLEVLEQVVKDRFQMDVAFGPPEILYKETIAAAVTGCGHFEPLGHYAEVHVKLEPAPRNSGILFQNACHPDVLTVNYQHVIEQHLLERGHHGLLTGSPITDLRITLLKGRAHNKHTSGGDFREATYRALRQGLEKADNILLEPYYDVKIKVDADDMGRVLTDIQKAHGRFDPPEFAGGKAVITGKVPVAAFMNYSAELAAFTQGKGTIQLMFGGYGECHNREEVMAKKAYNKDADPSYTSSSMFCSKGQAYSVPWDEAEQHMHV